MLFRSVNEALLMLLQRRVAEGVVVRVDQRCEGVAATALLILLVPVSPVLLVPLALLLLLCWICEELAHHYWFAASPALETV